VTPGQAAPLDTPLLFGLYLPLFVVFVGWAVASLFLLDPLVRPNEHDAHGPEPP
jgi:hypothetical protein